MKLTGNDPHCRSGQALVFVTGYHASFKFLSAVAQVFQIVNIQISYCTRTGICGY